MTEKLIDLCFSNPPYNNGTDLKIIKETLSFCEEMVVVHPSSWIIDLKGKSSLFKQIRNLLEKSIESISLFNGNKIFNIKLFVPCCITHIITNKTSKDGINVDYFGREFKVNEISDITKFGPEWKIVRPFIEKIAAYIDTNGSLWDKRVNKETSGKYYAQLAAIRANVSDNPDVLVNDDFYTLVMKESEKNKGIRIDLIPGNDCVPTYEFETEIERDNFIEYCKTYFVRFCLSLLKISQNCHRGEMYLIPQMDFAEEWNDEKLYKFFDIDIDTQRYIESFLPDYYGLRK
jgi:hypothetical protein